jgi:hypothetical protein
MVAPRKPVGVLLAVAGMDPNNETERASRIHREVEWSNIGSSANHNLPKLSAVNKLQIDNCGIHQQPEKLSRNSASGKRWLASRFWPRGLRESPGSCCEHYMWYRNERTLVSPRETSRAGDKH